MGEEINKAYYAVIPANVRYDTELPPNAKLLYGEITALCNQTGYCWASNEYFASLYKCKIRTIQRWLSSLKDRGYISVQLERKDGSKEVEKRYIKLNISPDDKNVTGYGQECHEGNDKNVTPPDDENVTYNNTSSFNNTSNKKKERKKNSGNSYDEILSAIEYDGLRELYYEYLKMRKLIKAPMTDRALKLLIKRVNELEPVDIIRQKKLLENAIQNNWKSVYPLKDEEEKDKPTQYQIAAEKLKRKQFKELQEFYT